jgi:hypothetical protein
VLPANPREPLLQYASLADVHVQAAAAVAAPADWHTVIAAANGPLLLVHQAEPRLAELTFDVHHSDLPLRPAFPVLVQHLVSALLPGGFESQVFPLGSPVSLVPPPGATSLDVTDPGGGHQRLSASSAHALVDTPRPGVYTVHDAGPGGEHTSRFIVEPQDVSQSQIGPGPAPALRAAAGTVGSTRRGTLEIWPWLAGAALAGVGFEWLVFLRG